MMTEGRMSLTVHVLLFCLALGAVFASSTGESSSIPVFDLTPLEPIIDARANVYGHNEPVQDWHGTLSGRSPFFYDGNTLQFDPEWNELIHTFPLRWLRFHMGNTYAWKDAVGPIQMRKPFRTTYGILRTEVGLDEFLRWAESLPEPPIVSLISSPIRDPQENADLVAYCNSTEGPMAEWRAINGHPAPYNVCHWELGNEVDWIKRQDEDIMRVDEPYEYSVEDYIELCRETIQAMRAVDPTIKIYAHAKTAPWSITQPNWPHWHREVIKELGHLIDGIVIHPYYDGYTVPYCLQSIDTVIADIHALGPKDRQLTVWVNEHARWTPNLDDNTTWVQTGGLQGAISTADFLMELMIRPEVEAANYWAYGHRGPWQVLNADWENNASPKFGTGIYHLYHLLNEAYLPKVQAIEVDHKGFSDHPKGYNYTVNAVLFSDPETNKKALVAINRSPQQDFMLNLKLKESKNYRVRQLLLTGEELTTVNTPSNPNALELQDSDLKICLSDDGHMVFHLPAKSVVAWIWE